MEAPRSIFRHDQRNPQTAVEALAARGMPPELRTKLLAFLTTAPDREVYRFNAYALAANLGLQRREMLTVLAPTVLEGVFNLNWEVHCNHCHHQQPAFAALSSATAHHICGGCRGEFNATLDDQVRVTFSINDTLRTIAPLSNEDEEWRYAIDDQYGFVTGHDLLTVQVFRDLFVNEPIPTHESFEIRRLTLMFTDLGGSTALYALKGDPRAYTLVREHYNLLFAIIANAGGAVVKTIGDAIMAVFPLSDLALRAAIQCHEAMLRFNHERQLPPDEALLLKVGLHSGPCLAVTLNDRLDYFGTTVNAAARAEKAARGGELVFTAEVEQSLQDPSALDKLTLTTEQFTFRGLDDRPFLIYKTHFTPEAASSLQ